MAGKNLELALLLKLNDQMSKGLKAAMQSVEKDSTSAGKSLARIAQETNKIRPTGIDRLNVSLKKMHDTAKSTLSTLAKIGSAGAQAGAAVMAGGYVAKSAVERPMAYDRSLASLSNTANSDNQDAAFRILQKDRLDAAIRAATKFGGSTEDAINTLNTLVASGQFGDVNRSAKLLPQLQKYATASDASGGDLASLAVDLKQNMGISDEEIPAALSKAIKAGQMGRFELKDMVKHLPDQMSKASALGMKGMAGFESLLASNQVSRVTGGTSDAAGINMTNLLNKINAQDTAHDFAKIGYDLRVTLADARKKGIFATDAFISLASKVALKDERFVALKKKYDKESNADKKLTEKAMLDILQQGALGTVIQDSQAMSAFLAHMQQADLLKSVKSGVAKESGREGEVSFQVVSSTPSFKADQLANAKDYAAIDSLKSIDAPLGKLLDKTNELAEAHPKLAERAYEAATALGVLSAAAGIGGLVGLLTRGKGGALEKAAEVAKNSKYTKYQALQKAAAAARPAISYAGEIPASVAAARAPVVVAEGAAAVTGGGIGLAGLAGIAAAGTGLFAMIRHAMEPDKTSMRMPDKNVSIAQRVEDYWNVAPERQTGPRRPNNPAFTQPLLNGVNGQQAGMDDVANSLNQVLKGFVSQTIKVDVGVDVKNGNIVAEVNKVNSHQARRN